MTPNLIMDLFSLKFAIQHTRNIYAHLALGFKTQYSYMDNKTINWLSLHSNIKDVDYDHLCSSMVCYPRNAEMLGAGTAELSQLDPNIFICRFGKIHRCGPECPGIETARGCFSCPVSGKVVDLASYIEFEEPQGHFGSKLHRRSSLGAQMRLAETMETNERSMRSHAQFEQDMRLNTMLHGAGAMPQAPAPAGGRRHQRKNLRMKATTRDLLTRRCRKSVNMKYYADLVARVETARDIRVLLDVDKRVFPKHQEVDDVAAYLIGRQSLPLCVQNNKDRLPQAVDKKLLRMYPVYFPSASLACYHRDRVTGEQLALQFGELSIANLVKKRMQLDATISESFINDVYSNIKTSESVMKIIMPGISRTKQVVGSSQTTNMLFAMVIKYIEDCALYRVPVDFAKVLTVLNYDYQRACEIHFDDMVEKDHQQFQAHVEHLTPRVVPILDSWPTLLEWCQYIKLVFALSELAKCNGMDQRAKRKTIDPLEAVLGSFDVFGKSGITTYKPWGAHSVFVPKVRKLGQPGYLLPLNKWNRLKGGSKGHKDGLGSVKRSVEFLGEWGYTPREVRRIFQKCVGESD